jgi:hypothetical protein
VSSNIPHRSARLAHPGILVRRSQGLFGLVRRGDGGCVRVGRRHAKEGLRKPPVLTGDVILREGEATYGWVAGRLYLTDRRLLYEGYPTDETASEITALFDRESYDQKHQVSIPILGIAEIKPIVLGIDPGSR